MIKMILRQYRALLISATLCSALSAVAGIVLISYVNTEVSTISNGGSPVMSAIVAFVGGLMAMVLLGTGSQILLAKLSTSVVSKLRGNIIRNVLCSDYEQIEATGGHRLHATMTSDVSSIASSLTLLPTLMFNLTTVLLCLAYLAYLSLLHFAVLLLSLMVMVVGAYLLMGYARKYFMLLREQEDTLFGGFKTLVDGGKELNLNLQRKKWFYQQIIEPGINKIKNTEFTAQLYWSVSSNWTNLTVFGLMGLIVYAFNSILPTTVEVLVGYIFVIIYFVGPLNFVISAMQPMTRGMVAYRKVQSLKLAQPSDYQLPPSEAKLSDWQQLTLSELQYHYKNNPDEEQAFSVGPLNLTINKGELLFITGGNGSGKSTFAKLITGLYTPCEGSITLDGQLIDKHNQQWYRNCFSTIFSDFYLFDQALDKQGKLADDATIAPLLKTLQLDGKVTSNKGILSTTRLSQGQRKRLALLLAYLEDSPIFLFDEWAADQDPHFRHYFYTQLLPQLKAQGKTVLAITHDDRYFALADRIIKFDNGKLEMVDLEAPLASNTLPSQALAELI